MDWIHVSFLAKEMKEFKKVVDKKPKSFKHVFQNDIFPKKGIALIFISAGLFHSTVIAGVAKYHSLGRAADIQTLYMFEEIHWLNKKTQLKRKKVMKNVADDEHKKYLQSTWGKTKKIEKEYVPSEDAAIKKSDRILWDHVQGLLGPDPLPPLKRDDVLRQRDDSIRMSMKMFDFSISDLEYSDNPEINKLDFIPSSYLLPDSKPPEDNIILHDIGMFYPDLELTADILGGVYIFKKDDLKLKIINANRRRVETSTGADLIIHHCVYDSYTIIQYKKMTCESGVDVYRPDEQCRKQIEAMKNLSTIIDTGDVNFNPSHYRLGTDFCFFKICSSCIDDDREKPYPGMLFPLEFLCRFLDSNKALGPNGGIRVTRTNSERHFNNSTFAEMVKNGWFGSRPVDSRILGDIINTSLNENRVVTISEFSKGDS